jgi:MATE family multidrug resistance protein
VMMGIVGLMMALPPGVAQLDGARRRGEVAALFRQAVWLALLVGAAMQQLTWWAAPMVVGWVGAAPDLAAETVSFMRALSFGAPAIALFCACRGLTDGVSRPRISPGCWRWPSWRRWPGR